MKRHNLLQLLSDSRYNDYSMITQKYGIIQEDLISSIKDLHNNYGDNSINELINIYDKYRKFDKHRGGGSGSKSSKSKKTKSPRKNNKTQKKYKFKQDDDYNGEDQHVSRKNIKKQEPYDSRRKTNVNNIGDIEKITNSLATGVGTSLLLNSVSPNIKKQVTNTTKMMIKNLNNNLHLLEQNPILAKEFYNMTENDFAKLVKTYYTVKRKIKD
jgi:hypothetical protein